MAHCVISAVVDHAVGDADLTCWCQPEVLGDVYPLAVP